METVIDYIDEPTIDYYLFGPKRFPIQRLDPSFATLYTDNPETGRWQYPKEFEHIQDKFKRVDEDLADKIQDESGAQQILKLIKAIP